MSAENEWLVQRQTPAHVSRSFNQLKHSFYGDSSDQRRAMDRETARLFHFKALRCRFRSMILWHYLVYIKATNDHAPCLRRDHTHREKRFASIQLSAANKTRRPLITRLQW